MKIRAVADLQDYIDTEKSWRKRELSDHYFMVVQARPHQVPVLLRSGICLIYAHWEGFSKNVATKYLDYIGSMGVRLRDLSNNLVAACLRSQISQCGDARRPTMHTDLVHILRGDLDGRVRISGDELVDTRSNLNSDVLRELTCLLGIDFSLYQDKSALLDEKLLKHRNTIAHGQFLLIDEDDYETLHNEIIGMIDSLGDQVLNLAVYKLYKASS
jgi:hypothetical protein